MSAQENSSENNACLLMSRFVILSLYTAIGNATGVAFARNRKKTGGPAVRPATENGMIYHE